MIDTSGEPLHKRGYRKKSNLAPVRETIAAAMVMLSYWKFEEPLLDPFCGSGTIPNITACDIDPYALELTKNNALSAGVAEFINVKKCDARDITADAPCGSIITNPPYGERLSDTDECARLYSEIGKSFSKLDRWSYYILTSHENFESEFGRKADRRRKIYNGMLRCHLYQYYGNKPKKKK